MTLTERDTKNYRMRREQILITVGRLTHVKGIDMLAELAPKVLSRHEYCMQDFAGSFFPKTQEKSRINLHPPVFSGNGKSFSSSFPHFRMNDLDRSRLWKEPAYLPLINIRDSL